MNLAKLALLITLFASVIVGCDSGGPDPKVEVTRLNAATQMRSLFDNAGGDYSRLNASDKAAFDKLAGGAEHAQEAWGQMKFGPNGGTSPASEPEGRPDLQGQG